MKERVLNFFRRLEWDFEVGDGNPCDPSNNKVLWSFRIGIYQLAFWRNFKPIIDLRYLKRF